MRRTFAVLTAGMLLATTTFALSAQTPAPRTEAQIQASFTSHRSEFDYLLGDWAFTSVSREWGPLRGFWSALRLAEGQILDEYRVVGDSGETYYVTTTLRAWNGLLDQWELVSADAGTGLRDLGTGRKVGSEMHIEQRFGTMSPHPTLWRIRYFNIRPDAFSWAADRSSDEGRTWVTNYLTIEARRIGPARTMASLAPARTR